MPLQVVNAQNMCMCTVGAAPTPLIVTSNMTHFCSKQLAATIMDCQPVTNITPFGVCATKTAAASGVAQPCLPVPTGTWMPGSTTKFIHGIPALRDCDKLICGVGGMISVSLAGQVQHDVD